MNYRKHHLLENEILLISPWGLQNATNVNSEWRIEGKFSGLGNFLFGCSLGGAMAF